jgi:hypothetical protein
MTSESSSDERFILRRVSDKHYTPGNPIEIQPVAFRPSSGDTDGLSVYFEPSEGGVTPEQLVADARPGCQFCVVRLSIRELERLGLSVIAAPTVDGLPGHALIPEINLESYHSKERKNSLKEVTKKLAELATRAIVLTPQ